MLLEQIQKPNDIHKIDPKDYPALAAEIRSFLLEKVSRTGGHLASNLGVVELTMALHLALDLPKDKLIFDVGHQCYTHKLLTGRREGFDTLRQFGGMSGFPRKSESDCDLFDTGHSSASISAGLGLAKARDLSGEDYAVVSVIGDGSLTGGMAYEALNNAAQLKSNFIIVLNDNNMSISRNIGGMSRALQDMRTAPAYHSLKNKTKRALDRIPTMGGRMVEGISRVKDSIKQLFLPGMVFENMHLTYLGPIDGHNIPQMVDALQDARRMQKAVVIHMITKKGRGYAPAEADPEYFHGVGPFELSTGKPLNVASQKTATAYAGETLLELAQKDKRVAAVTAAMTDGTGLKAFAGRFPERFFDVGIAEQHAVTFASGLAAGGLKPYVCIYSTFLQRAYDQIIHDICLQKANVTLLVDRAGLVGADGETHQGMLDASFLQTAPGLTLMAPRDGEELRQMLAFSLSFEGPLAIRYPRGAMAESLTDVREPMCFGKAEVLEKGRDIVLFAAGSMTETALMISALLKEKGLAPTVVNARFVKPFDEALLCSLADNHSLIAVLEENIRSGSLGPAVADFSERNRLSWQVLSAEPEDCFIPQGDIPSLKKMLGIDAESLIRRILAEAAGQKAGEESV